MKLRQEIAAPSDFAPGSLDGLRRSLILRFEEIVERHSDRPAVSDGEQTLTYRELEGAVNRLANTVLGEVGAGEAPLLLLLKSDASGIIGLLGAIKTGRPYVALHPSDPPERMQSIVNDCAPVCVLSSREFQPIVEKLRAASQPLHIVYFEDVDPAANADRPGIYPSPQSPMAIAYTSGTTGEPKGLVHSHGFVIWHMLRQIDTYFVSPSDRISLFSSLSFAASYALVMAAVMNGAAACIFNFNARGPQRALEWIRAEKITLLRMSPAIFRSIMEAASPGQIFESVRVVGLSGESSKGSDFELFKAHTAPTCILLNTFSSTDAGTLAMLTLGHDSGFAEDFLPAGYPIRDKVILLLDDDGKPVPAGEPGEIVVKSTHMASGFWGRPDLTAERYRRDPENPDVIVLRTGDLGRWRPDGMLQFMGRKDSMVKIRGQRVEITAVEAHLRRHPQVKEAVIVARPSRHRPDQLQLIAYVVPQADDSLTTAAMRQHLAGRLAEYMIPSFFVLLERLPLNVNGKVDREKLPAVSEREQLTAADLPADALEEKLIGIWAELLKLERVGVQDSFFDLGGDSLLVLSMALEVEKQISQRVPTDFFRQPTIRHLAQLLRNPETHSEAMTTDFKLVGDGNSNTSPDWERKRRSAVLITRISRALTDLRLVVDEAYIFEWFLAQRTKRLSFVKAKEMILRLADRPLLQKTVYRRKYALYRRVLNSLGVSTLGMPSLFRLNLINNVLFRLTHAWRPFSEPRNFSLNGARHGTRYFFERRQLIDEAPPDQLDGYFPVSGFEHLETAYRSGRGVILLSIQGGVTYAITHRVLARRLGSARFQTIAPLVPLRASEFRSVERGRIPEVSAAWLYSQVAYHGQQLLSQGQVIHIVGDNFAKGPGRTYPIRVGDREYKIRGGFAELALNTGAAVLPIHGRFLEDGRLLTCLEPALQPGAGNRAEQIESFVRQYEQFVNATLVGHPECLSWRQMKRHLGRAHIDPRQARSRD